MNRTSWLVLAAALGLGLGWRSRPRARRRQPRPAPRRPTARMRPGRHLPRRHRGRSSSGCGWTPGGKAFRAAWLDVGQGDPCLPRPRRRRHPDQGGGRPRLAAGDGPGRDRRRGGAARAPTSTPTRRTARSRSTSWPTSSGRPSGPFRVQVGRLADRAATTPSSTTSTATRTAAHQGRAGARRRVAPPLRPRRRRADRPDELEPFSNPIAAMTEDDQPRRGRVRGGAAGDRAVGRRPVVPARPAPAQEVRQGDERGRGRPATIG